MALAPENLRNLAGRILSRRGSQRPALPAQADVHTFVREILTLLYPHYSGVAYDAEDDVLAELGRIRTTLENALAPLRSELPVAVEQISERLFDRLPAIADLLDKDAQAIYDGDPAAESVDEVILAYPGFLAIAIHRVAHELHVTGVPLFPRIIAEYAHQLTGVDIHPGASIGESFCIDHGTSVVIGETTVIGNHVKLYQGVTLGALSVAKSLRDTKRHPTIEDRVVIYANATILGGDTVIGHDSIIGGNVWLTTSIPPYTRVYHKTEVHLASGSNYEI